MKHKRRRHFEAATSRDGSSLSHHWLAAGLATRFDQCVLSTGCLSQSRVPSKAVSRSQWTECGGWWNGIKLNDVFLYYWSHCVHHLCFTLLKILFVPHMSIRKYDRLVVFIKIIMGQFLQDIVYGIIVEEKVKITGNDALMDHSWWSTRKLVGNKEMAVTPLPPLFPVKIDFSTSLTCPQIMSKTNMELHNKASLHKSWFMTNLDN